MALCFNIECLVRRHVCSMPFHRLGCTRSADQTECWYTFKLVRKDVSKDGYYQLIEPDPCRYFPEMISVPKYPWYTQCTCSYSHGCGCSLHSVKQACTASTSYPQQCMCYMWLTAGEQRTSWHHVSSTACISLSASLAGSGKRGC